jgi:hypothetical protein
MTIKARFLNNVFYQTRIPMGELIEKTVSHPGDVVIPHSIHKVCTDPSPENCAFSSERIRT